MDNLFKNKGNIINGAIHLSPKEAYEACKKGAIIIDVREEFMSHVKTFDVPEIKIFPLRKFKEQIELLPSGQYLIFADATGVKSKPALEYALEKGFTNISNMAGGLVAWERDGLPTLTYQRLRVSGRNKCEFIHKKDIGKKR
jgi:rhodanese-related sulfurtransferase